MSKMRLADLFHGFDVDIIGNKNIAITGISSHSKEVKTGDMFVARKGRIYDGTQYIREAISNGAVAVFLLEYDDMCTDITQIVGADWGSVKVRITERFYDSPSKRLYLVGVTGTNGKTSVTYITRWLLGDANCGLCGTVEYVTGRQRYDARLTTPEYVTGPGKQTYDARLTTPECVMGQHRYDATLTTPSCVMLQKLMREMVDNGLKAAAIEVTSEGLDQCRTDGLEFDVAVLTNFSQEHLEYHKTMEEYMKAKQKLFTFVDDPNKIAVVNRDDPSMKEILGDCRAKIVTYGIKNQADFRAFDIQISLEETQFKVLVDGHVHAFRMGLIGDFNVLNALASIAIAYNYGVEIDTIKQRLSTFRGIKGRLEKIPNNIDCHIFIDFAHTWKGIEDILSQLHRLKSSRIITIFGCGGERDRIKRPKMAAAIQKFSDIIIVTSDNDRNEPHSEIIEEIYAGFINTDNVVHIEDRRQAIEQGIELAETGDIVVVVGRGHEQFLVKGREKIPLCDREVVKESLEKYKQRK